MDVNVDVPLKTALPFSTGASKSAKAGKCRAMPRHNKRRLVLYAHQDSALVNGIAPQLTVLRLAVRFWTSVSQET